MPAPVLNVSAMRAWEQATWAAGRTEREVIERVGRLLATRILRRTRPGDRVLVLAGPGHNGDDARCAVPHLADRDPAVLNVTDPAAALPELEKALQLPPALVLDGWFGIGLNRPLNADWIALIERLNAARLPVLAVDVPSGLGADAGSPLGAAVRATWTVTLGAPKSGLLRPAAWPFTGRVEVEPDIGLVPVPRVGELSWTLSSDFNGFPPPRPVDGHKGAFGHLLMLAGSRGYHGAAVLAARAAQRARPGLITLGTMPDVLTPVASQLQAVMVDDWEEALKKRDRATAVMMGPGLAAGNLPAVFKESMAALWAEARVPVVADASVLDWLPRGPVAVAPLRVITPHPGEAARLLGGDAAAVQADRVGALRAVSGRLGGAWVVLKGHQTLVGRETGPVIVNSSGDAALGQGGTGDLLAGYLAGLLAQPALAANPLQAIRYAVWQHGAAADRLGGVKPNWVPEELVPVLGTAAG